MHRRPPPPPFLRFRKNGIYTRTLSFYSRVPVNPFHRRGRVWAGPMALVRVWAGPMALVRVWAGPMTLVQIRARV
eukprot:1203373-Amorphochlora_amoeboformis.AAC.1